MRVVSFGFTAFFALCERSLSTLGFVDERLLGGAVLDSLLGPQESFEYSSTTSPGPPPPHS